jgi:hypothetical protein
VPVRLAPLDWAVAEVAALLRAPEPRGARRRRRRGQSKCAEALLDGAAGGQTGERRTRPARSAHSTTRSPRPGAAPAPPGVRAGSSAALAQTVVRSHRPPTVCTSIRWSVPAHQGLREHPPKRTDRVPSPCWGRGRPPGRRSRRQPRQRARQSVLKRRLTAPSEAGSCAHPRPDECATRPVWPDERAIRPATDPPVGLTKACWRTTGRRRRRHPCPQLVEREPLSANQAAREWLSPNRGLGHEGLRQGWGKAGARLDSAAADTRRAPARLGESRFRPTRLGESGSRPSRRSEHQRRSDRPAPRDPVSPSSHRTRPPAGPAPA